MAPASAQPLRFGGARRGRAAALPEGWEQAEAMPRLELEAPGAQEATTQLVTMRGREGIGLRITLPPSTPPGTYAGALRLGRQRRPIVVEVPADPRLRLLPDEVTLAAAAGAEVRASVVAINRGNVVIDLPPQPRLRFFQSPGLDRDPGRVFEVRVPGLAPIYARTDELQVSAGAVAQVVLLEGAGPLLPGEQCPLEIAVRVDPAATPGLRYFGDWSLAGETFALILDVAPPEPPAEEVS